MRSKERKAATRQQAGMRTARAKRWGIREGEYRPTQQQSMEILEYEAVGVEERNLYRLQPKQRAAPAGTRKIQA